MLLTLTDLFFFGEAPTGPEPPAPPTASSGPGWDGRYLFFFGGAAIPLLDFRSALRQRLKERASLAALEEIYWNTAGSRPEYPFLVINRIIELPFINNSRAYYDEAELQFTVLGTDEEAETLGRAAWEALRPIPENPPLDFLGGYAMTRLPGPKRGPVEQPGQGPGGRDVWAFSFDYTFIIGRY